MPVLLQYGSSEVEHLKHPLLTLRARLPSEELKSAIRKADMVISHGGDGSTRLLAEMGSRFVLVPREGALGEHVDDHQVEFAQAVAGLGVRVCRDIESLRAHVLNPPPPFAGALFPGPFLAEYLLARYPR